MSKLWKVLIASILSAPALFVGPSAIFLTSDNVSRSNVNLNSTTISNSLETAINVQDTISAANSTIKDMFPSLITSKATKPDTAVKTFFANCLSNKPSNFTANNITAIEVSDFSDFEGNAIITGIEVNLWTDNQGKTRESNTWINGSFTITDLKSHGSTTFNSVAAGSKYSNKIPNEMTDEELNSAIEDIIKTNINSIVTSVPSTFNIKNVSTSIINKNDENGTITVNLTLPCYYDYVKGAPVEETISNPVMITGFKSTRSGTSFKVSNTPITGFEDILAQDMVDFIRNGTNNELVEKLKEYIVANGLNNKPRDFGVNNITRVYTLPSNNQQNPYNNINGSLVISAIDVNNYLNRDGQPLTGINTQIQGVMIIPGFKKVKPTSVIGTSKITGELASASMSSITNKQVEDYVRKNISQFVKNYPDKTIDASNIIVQVEGKSLSRGQIKVIINTDKAFNKYGRYIPRSASGTVVLTGFKVDQLETTIRNTTTSVTGELAQLTPGEMNNYKYRDLLNRFIYDNMIVNPPSQVNGFVFGPEIIETINLSANQPTDGTLVIDSIVLNKYMNSDGILVTSPNMTFRGPFTISGFKVAVPTNVVSTINVSKIFPGLNVFQIDRSKLIKWLSSKDKTTNKYNWEQVFTNVPSGFQITENPETSSAIIEREEDFDVKPERNEITVRFIVKHFIGTNGEVVLDGRLPLYTTFTDFVDSKKSTYVVAPDETIKGFENIAAESALSEEYADENYNKNLNVLKLFIINNLIVNKPPSTLLRELTVEDLSDIKISKFNNKEGTIDISSFTLSKWLDNNGKPGTGKKEFDYPLVIEGFKKIGEPTWISKEVNVNKESDIYSLNVSDITDDMVIDYILGQREKETSGYQESIINGLPSKINKTNFRDYVSLNINRDTDNQTISMRVKVKLYFSDDETRSLKLGDELIGECNIVGFRLGNLSWIERNEPIFWSSIGVAIAIVVTIILMAIISSIKKNRDNKKMYRTIITQSNQELLQNKEINDRYGMGGIAVAQSLENSAAALEVAAMPKNFKLTKESKRAIKQYKKDIKKRKKLEKKYLKELDKRQSYLEYQERIRELELEQARNNLVAEAQWRARYSAPIYPQVGASNMTGGLPNPVINQTINQQPTVPTTNLQSQQISPSPPTPVKPSAYANKEVSKVPKVIPPPTPSRLVPNKS